MSPATLHVNTEVLERDCVSSKFDRWMISGDTVVRQHNFRSAACMERKSWTDTSTTTFDKADLSLHKRWAKQLRKVLIVGNKTIVSRPGLEVSKSVFLSGCWAVLLLLLLLTDKCFARSDDIFIV